VEKLLIFFKKVIQTFTKARLS